MSVSKTAPTHFEYSKSTEHVHEHLIDDQALDITTNTASSCSDNRNALAKWVMTKIAYVHYRDSWRYCANRAIHLASTFL